MFVRVFCAMVVTVFVGLWAFNSLFTSYQDRATAETLAPLWLDAVRQTPAEASGLRTTRRVESSVEMIAGLPPPTAVDLTIDVRMAALISALAKLNVSVSQIRLDDSVDPAVTWMRVADAGESRWVGIVGGPQPSEFRRHLTLALLSLVVVLVAVAAFVSRWATAPLSQLIHQVDVISRGEIPRGRVSGPREIQRLGDALQSMAARRRDDDDRLSVMLLGVSHDLRSPLGRIRVAAELLGHDGQELAELIVSNVEQADAIIESFLIYMRAGADPRSQDVDLGLLAASAAALAGLAATQVSVRAPTWVRGDPVLLQRCVANLIDNAQKHGAEPIEINVGPAIESVAAVLTVNDSGAGISDPDRLRRAFERGDSSRESRGAGLGLAIVDRIAAQHDGNLEIGRNVHGGASLSLRLTLSSHQHRAINPWSKAESV